MSAGGTSDTRWELPGRALGWWACWFRHCPCACAIADGGEQHFLHDAPPQVAGGRYAMPGSATATERQCHLPPRPSRARPELHTDRQTIRRIIDLVRDTRTDVEIGPGEAR